MKKCPKIVKGIKNKIKWLFSGYSYHYKIGDEYYFSSTAYHIFDIIKNLRNRRFEHLLVEDKSKNHLAQFIQTITNGKLFRVEVSLVDIKGKQHIIMTEVSNYIVCADIFVSVLLLKQLPNLKWIDISDDKWNGKDIIRNKNIIYFNPEWIDLYNQKNK